MSAKNVILTAITFRGLAAVRSDANKLASNALCSRAYVLRIARDVEAGRILIKAN